MSTPTIKSIQTDAYSYRRLRRVIGFLGIALPISLLAFSLPPFFNTSIQPTISHYYYTNLREIFTGILCAVGLFMIRYKGLGNTQWWKNDNLLTNIAGVMAISIAFIPTNPLKDTDKIDTLIPYAYPFIGFVHYGLAIILFLSFSILSLFVFTLGQEQTRDIPTSIINENHIYRFCGISILVFIILIPISDVLHWSNYSTLIFEALSLFSFGIAWLIKGRVLGDEGKIGETLYREHN
jgi:hypothetical protein